MTDTTQSIAPAGEPFSVDFRVYYEDTDAAGVVYYANYLRFMERARTEWLRALDIPMDVESGRRSEFAKTVAREMTREHALEQETLDTEAASQVSGDAPALPIFVVRRAEVDYGEPARLNDLLRVSVRLDAESIRRRLRGAAFWLEQSVTRLETAAHAPGPVLASARIRIASVDRESLRPRRLPAWVTERILLATH